MAYIIKRTRTGTYHAGQEGSQYPRCSQSLTAAPAHRHDVEQASGASFCKKCFPSGKPSSEKIELWFKVGA